MALLSRPGSLGVASGLSQHRGQRSPGSKEGRCCSCLCPVDAIILQCKRINCSSGALQSAEHHVSHQVEPKSINLRDEEYAMTSVDAAERRKGVRGQGLLVMAN